MMKLLLVVLLLRGMEDAAREDWRYICQISTDYPSLYNFFLKLGSFKLRFRVGSDVGIVLLLNLREKVLPFLLILEIQLFKLLNSRLLQLICSWIFDAFWYAESGPSYLEVTLGWWFLNFLGPKDFLSEFWHKPWPFDIMADVFDEDDEVNYNLEASHGNQRVTGRLLKLRVGMSSFLCQLYIDCEGITGCLRWHEVGLQVLEWVQVCEHQHVVWTY